MIRAGWMMGSFLAMYAVATVLGFATYLLASPRVMWICVFTLMPLFSALLLYGYLTRMKISRGTSLRECLLVAGVWIVLSFALDAVTYILVVPRLRHAAPNWAFFQDQSPWIWVSYLVLLLSAFAAQRVYVRKADA